MSFLLFFKIKSFICPALSRYIGLSESYNFKHPQILPYFSASKVSTYARNALPSFQLLHQDEATCSDRTYLNFSHNTLRLGSNRYCGVAINIRLLPISFIPSSSYWRKVSFCDRVNSPNGILSVCSGTEYTKYLL